LANEARGILFETITEAALQRAVKIAGISGEVRWNEKPKGMSVVPDFTIGIDKDRLSHVVLVTASGAAKNAEMKSWRNLGELQEVKAQLANSPTVLNLYFKSEVKQGLSLATQRLYDTTIHVEKKPYHRYLEAWVTTNLDATAKTRQARRELLESIVGANVDLAAAVETLSRDLAEALQERNEDLSPLWALMSEDYDKPHAPATARTTSVRRGLGKLLVLEPKVRQLVYEHHRKIRGIPLEQMPDYAVTLGFFKRIIGGARLDDDEIKGVLSLLGPEICEAALLEAPEAMGQWINPLRNLERVQIHAEFVEQHYAEVCDPIGLKNLFIECFDSPAELLGVSGDDGIWIFGILVTLLKAKSSKRQGYGASQLAVDTKVPEFGSGGFLIPPFIQRKKMLGEAHLSALSSGLAERFSANVSQSDISRLKEKLPQLVKEQNLEDRLIPYRNFEPLLWLLEVELRKQDITYLSRGAYEGWINEYAEVGRKVATTPFVKVGTMLIHWKSVSDAGKVHKKKELAARARSVKYQYHVETGAFTRRNGVDRLALIVDGTFDDADLKVLSEAGWDHIVYPDEIEHFVSELSGATKRNEPEHTA
jgi:hypothetical protein